MPRDYRIRHPNRKREVSWRQQASRDRRSMRGAQRGRETEKRVEKILAEMVAAGDILDFVYSLPNSTEDAGRTDFTVRRAMDGSVHARSFGITISGSRYRLCSNFLRPDCPNIQIPPDMTDTRIRERILMLFDDKDAQDG